MNLCELVRTECDADRMFCLYPYRETYGLVQACGIAYNKATYINLRFFDEKYHIQVWVDTITNDVHFYPNHESYNCFYIKDFSLFLYTQNKEAFFLFLYSLFFNMKRAAYAAVDAAAYAYDVYVAAVAAADAAKAAAYAAADAAADAYATAVAAYAAAYAAAADAAKATADAAKPTTDAIRKALRALFKFRKKMFGVNKINELNGDLE